MKKLTTEEFIAKAKKIHGDKYDYSKAIYENCRTKVCIICPEHGEFWQLADNHLRNESGCPICWKNKRGISKSFTKEYFIEKAKIIHGNKYDYSKVNYTRSKDKVCIICPEHGEFYQQAHHHLNGHGCKKCAIAENAINNFKNTDGFISEARLVHGNKYDYSKVVYKGCYEKVCIICKKHGEFWQLPYCHLQGQGCPACNNSILESKTLKELEKLEIKFIQKCDKNVFPWLNKQHLDFYLPDYNIAIECQGIQHYKPIEYFGGENKLIYIRQLDERKNKLCKEHNIKLGYITYEEDVQTKINEILTL